MNAVCCWRKRTLSASPSHAIPLAPFAMPGTTPLAILFTITFAILLTNSLIVPSAFAQGSAQGRDLQLFSLSAFQPPTSNWQIAGTASASRASDRSLVAGPGAGLLVNLPADNATGNLTTDFAHSDIQLDLEVLIPKNSDSGVFLQGRYEIQLADSWGAKTPDSRQFGSISSIKPPSVNVARAPGLWQKLSILFRAPRFDASGQKIKNAAFVRVVLNGTTIQEEVELDGPTPGAPGTVDASGNLSLLEVASAPLVFQGDDGPVAFRKIRYDLLNNGPVAIENLTYAYYRGDFGWELPDVGALNRIGGGSVPAITSSLADTLNNFALTFEGDLVVPATGKYRFEVTYTGQFALLIDGKTVVDIDSPEIAAVGDVPRKAAATNLRAGRHSFALTYARGRWHVALNALGLYVSGPGSIRTRLSAAGSDPDAVWAAFKVDPGEQPRLQRSFVMHPSGERVHAISVGYPNGNHYAYDTGTGALLHVWRGRFIDTSTMWFSRGNDQSAAPQGSLIEMSGRPTVASELVLVTETASAPSVSDKTDLTEPPTEFRFLNYRLDADGNPTFSYTANGWSIKDRLAPDADEKFFVRTLIATGPDRDDGPIPLRLADAEEITKVADGVYDIDEGTYHIEVLEGSVEIIDADGVQQLVAIVPGDGGEHTVKVNLVW